MSLGAGPRYSTLTDIIKNFTPAWFSCIMGTGSISVLFHNFPYANDSFAIKTLTAIFFFLNVTLFIIFNIISIARYTLYPDIWRKMMRHPLQNLYLGSTYPMGLTTIINVAVGLLYEGFGWGGTGFLYFLWGVWWADVAISFACCFIGVHHMITRQEHSLSESTTIWLLPVVTLTVASSSGGVLSTALLEVSPRHALITTTFSAMMVSNGIALSFIITTLYFGRIVIYGLPKGPLITSVWLNLGPAGQAGYSFLEIGTAFQTLLPLTYGDSTVLRSSPTGDTINVICICIAFFLWSFATAWFFYSLLAVYEIPKEPRFGFQMGFWGMIFPNGVYANLTIQLYRTFDSPFFRVYGAMYAVFTMLLWLFVATGSIIRMRHFQILLTDTGLGLVKYDPNRYSKRAVSAGTGDTSPATQTPSVDSTNGRASRERTVTPEEKV